MKKYEPWVLTLVSGFAVYLFDKLLGPRIPWEKINGKGILQWLTFDIKGYQVVLFGLIFGISYLVFRRIRKNRSSYYSRSQRKLREFNNADIGGVLWKWNVFFDYTGKPLISDLTPYCKKHGSTPLKMKQTYYGFSCLACNTAIPKGTNTPNSIEGIVHLIESELEQKWETINKP